MATPSISEEQVFHHPRNLYEVRVEIVESPKWGREVYYIQYRRTADTTNRNFKKLVRTKAHVFLRNFKEGPLPVPH